MLRNEWEFADGLTEWLKGSDEVIAEVAANLLAETILMHRAWLEGQMKG
jgi:hypothetical protein